MVQVEAQHIQVGQRFKHRAWPNQVYRMESKKLTSYTTVGVRTQTGGRAWLLFKHTELLDVVEEKD